MTTLELAIVILFMFLDLAFILKPDVPLLNLFMGLFSGGITLTTYAELPLFPWMSLLMVLLTILVSYRGLDAYFSSGTPNLRKLRGRRR